MPGIVVDGIDEYIDRLASRGDAALQAVEKQGRDEDWPIVGPAEGSLLHVLARSIGARRGLQLRTPPAGVAKPGVGGLLATDNVLWPGGVAKPPRTKEAPPTHEYNTKLAADPRMVTVTVPPRDGVSNTQKVRD